MIQRDGTFLGETVKRAVLVGLGGRARHWLSNCREHPDVELVGYVELADVSIKKAVEEWDIPAGAIYPSVGDVSSSKTVLW